MQKRRLLSLFAVVFIDLLGFGLILPLLPYYADTYHASNTVVGLLIASYSAAQLLGVSVLGRLSDRFGRRPIMLFSVLGTCSSFLLLGVANSLWLLFASRLLDGITGGNITVARAYITDVTDENNRARGMGLIGAAFGLSFVFGPAMGGILSAGEQYELPAFIAAALAFLSFLVAFFWLPESLTDERRQELQAQPGTSFSRTALHKALARPGVAPLLQISFVFGLAFAMFEGVFSLYAQRHLDLESTQTGYLLAYIGLLIAFVQGSAIGRLTKRYREPQLIVSGAAILIPSLIAWAFAPTIATVIIVLMPLSLAVGVLNATIHSVLTKQVKHQDVGGVLGLSSALGSVTRIIGPVSGAVALDLIGAPAPGILSALLATWLLIYSWRYFALHSTVISGAEMTREQSPI